jgi:hypothetical protein
VFAGCTPALACDVTNAMNIGEYYPFHWLASCSGYLTCTRYARPSNSADGYGRCPGTADTALNGFLTQREFAWGGNDSPPTPNERASEWTYASSCVPSGTTMPMGKY